MGTLSRIKGSYKVMNGSPSTTDAGALLLLMLLIVNTIITIITVVVLFFYSVSTEIRISSLLA